MSTRRPASSPWFTLTLLVSVALTACAGPATPTAPTATPPTQAPPTQAVASQVPETPGSLTLLDWSGYEIPEFWKAFAAKHPDLQPTYTFMGESAEGFAKVQSGFEADLFHPCSNYWKLSVDSGLVQPIDTSRLKNWPGVRPALAQQGEFNGKQYFIPWDWGYESILVRTDKVKTTPASWADLWNPEYKGHLALFDSGESNFILTAVSLGFDPWNTTADQNEQVKQKLLELKPNILNYWTDATALDQMVASGDVWVAASAWNQTYKDMLDQKVPVAYTTPQEGRMGFLCGFGLLTTSKNVDLAYDMIDAYLAPDSMAYLSNSYGYGASSEAALAQTDPNTIKLLDLDKSDVINRTIFYRSVTAETRQLFTNLWSEVKAAP